MGDKLQYCHDINMRLPWSTEWDCQYNLNQIWELKRGCHDINEIICFKCVVGHSLEGILTYYKDI